MTTLSECRFGVGPMSKNVVDACIEFVETRQKRLILIPSRNQVEWSGGYANGWTTAEFVNYVKSRTSRIFLERDHGGPGQVQPIDDGLKSLSIDCQHMDIIHLDPWKVAKDLEDGCIRTVKLLKYCHHLNKNVMFEVGTEQAIFPYESDGLDFILTYLRASLTPAEFEMIKFAVIQSGTSLKGNENTGHYSASRLSDMLQVCVDHRVMSKEHNGDYLPIHLVHSKLAAGLNSINIAPEFGQIETEAYLSEIHDSQTFDSFYDICLESKRWVRWLGAKPPENKSVLINACGHYVLSTPRFVSEVRGHVRKDIDNVITSAIIDRLDRLHGS
jgi:hypothetical protein